MRYLFSSENGFDYYEENNKFFKTKDCNTVSGMVEIKRIEDDENLDNYYK